MKIPETRYATTTDGLSIAYQQFGSGPHVVWVTGTASHVELFWELPGWANTLRRLSERATVTWFDKRGTGLSDRVLLSESLESRMGDILAVMDDAGIESADLIGLSESGAMSALFAATFPERVRRLVIVASWAFQPDAAGADAFEQYWGQGLVLEAVWAQGHPDGELLGRMERAMGTPKSMAALLRANARLDVRPVLPLVHTETLVVHCTNDPIIAVDHGREFASLLPHSTLVEVGGAFHGSARREDMDRYADAIEQFLFGVDRTVAPSTDRVLATVLFTDIVGSTDRAVQVGDTRWAELLDDHDRICTRAVEAARGRMVKMTGDGVLATFDGPASAIATGHQMIRELRLIGLDIRAGVHTGEIERRGEDIGGIGVNLASRGHGFRRRRRAVGLLDRSRPHDWLRRQVRVARTSVAEGRAGRVGALRHAPRERASLDPTERHRAVLDRRIFYRIFYRTSRNQPSRARIGRQLITKTPCSVALFGITRHERKRPEADS